jgi:hypothetical protein
MQVDLRQQRVCEWLAVQPTAPLPYTILLGGFYAEMLYSLYAPKPSPNDPTLHIFKAAIGTGYVPFFELAQYGRYTRWIFDNPSRSVGKTISVASYATNLQDIVDAFEKVTGERAKGESVSFDDWWTGPDPNKKIPVSVPGGEDDDTRFTVKKSFGALFHIWSDYILIGKSQEKWLTFS